MKRLLIIGFVMLFFGALALIQVNAETCGAPYSNWPTELPPAAGTLGAPTGITATPGDASIALSWNAVPGATGYKITINDGTKIATKVITGTGTSTTLSGTIGQITITNGTTYQIKMQTQNKSDADEDQYGPYSSIVCATPSGGTTTTSTSTTTTSSTTTTTSSTTTTTTLPALPTCDQMNSYKSKMDVNGDGKIDANDAALIIRYLKLNCQSK